MRRLLLAAAALGFVASIGRRTRRRIPRTPSRCGTWLPCRPATRIQALGTAGAAKRGGGDSCVAGTHFGSVPYSEPINDSLNLGRQSATIFSFSLRQPDQRGCRRAAIRACGNLR